MVRTFSKKRSSVTNFGKNSSRKEVIRRFSDDAEEKKEQEKDDEDVILEKLDSILSRLDALEDKVNGEKVVVENCGDTDDVVDNSDEGEGDDDFLEVNEEEVVESLSNTKMNKNSNTRNVNTTMLGQESFSCLFK